MGQNLGSGSDKKGNLFGQPSLIRNNSPMGLQSSMAMQSPMAMHSPRPLDTGAKQ